MHPFADVRLHDLEAAVQELGQEVRQTSLMAREASGSARAAARQRLRSLRGRQRFLAAELASHRREPHGLLEIVERELDDLWATLSEAELGR